jgi:hypothetical protein
MADAPEAGDECQDCDHDERKLVVPLPLHCLFCDALELVDHLLCVHARSRFCVSRAAFPSSLVEGSIGGHD